MLDFFLAQDMLVAKRLYLMDKLSLWYWYSVGISKFTVTQDTSRVLQQMLTNFEQKAVIERDLIIDLLSGKIEMQVVVDHLSRINFTILHYGIQGGVALFAILISDLTAWYTFII